MPLSSFLLSQDAPQNLLRRFITQTCGVALALSLQAGMLNAAAPEPSAAASTDVGAASATEPPSANSITFHIYAKGTGKALPRADVRVGKTTVYSDPDGKVKIDKIITPTDRIVIRLVGYETTDISVEDLRSREMKVHLIPAQPDDDTIVIVGKRRAEPSRKTVTVKEAERVAPGGDPAQIPKLLPGTQTRPFQPAPVVRGTAPSGSTYRIDGVEVPFLYHPIGGLSIIPQRMLDSVEFSSGGFGAQYGESTGGAIVLRTKKEIVTEPTSEVRVNLPLYSSVFHERPAGENASVSFSGRRSYLEAFLPLFLKGNDLTLIPYFGDAHVMYKRGLSEGQITTIGMYAYDGIRVSVNSDIGSSEDGRGRFHMVNGFGVLSTNVTNSIGSGWTVDTTPQFQQAFTRAEVLDNTVNVKTYYVAAPTEFSYRLSQREKLYLGFQPGWIRADVDLLVPQNREDDPNFDFEEAPKVNLTRRYTGSFDAAWMAVDQHIGDLTLTPGIRAFYNAMLRETSADPRLIANWEVATNHTVKGAVGQYSQSPRPEDAASGFGNPDLTYQKSNHYILGVESQFTDKWTAEVQVFYKRSYHLVRSHPTKIKSNDGSLRSKGFEFFFRRNATDRLFYWLAYTYSVTEERDSDDEAFRPGQYDQTHVLNLAGNYKLTGTWEIGGRAVYHTGDTADRIGQVVYNTNLDKYQARFDPEGRGRDRLPAYHELDIYATHDSLFDSWTLEKRFGVEYIALKPQTLNNNYNYDFSKKEPFSGLPPIPYFEMRAQF